MMWLGPFAREGGGASGGPARGGGQAAGGGRAPAHGGPKHQCTPPGIGGAARHAPRGERQARASLGVVPGGGARLESPWPPPAVPQRQSPVAAAGRQRLTQPASRRRQPPRQSSTAATSSSSSTSSAACPSPRGRPLLRPLPAAEAAGVGGTGGLFAHGPALPAGCPAGCTAPGGAATGRERAGGEA